jgi:hypothetical protein
MPVAVKESERVEERSENDLSLRAAPPEHREANHTKSSNAGQPS